MFWGGKEINMFVNGDCRNGDDKELRNGGRCHAACKEVKR